MRGNLKKKENQDYTGKKYDLYKASFEKNRIVLGLTYDFTDKTWLKFKCEYIPKVSSRKSMGFGVMPFFKSQHLFTGILVKDLKKSPYCK